MAVARFRVLFPCCLLVTLAWAGFFSGEALAQPVATLALCGDGDGNIGTNWISLPTHTDMTTAEDLCLSIPGAVTVSQGVADSLPATSLRWVFDCATGACTSSQTIPEPGCALSDCFCIDPGEGYEVITAADTPWDVNQCDRFDPIALPVGFQNYLVSIPFDTFLVTANDLAEHVYLPNQGIVRGTVTGINCATGALTTCNAGTAGCDAFLLQPGRAYRVRYTTPTTGISYTNPVSCVPAAPPALADCPIGDLSFTDDDTFTWTAPVACPLPLLYDAIRGDLACLRGSCRQSIPALTPPCAGCLLLEDDDGADTTTVDAESPELGIGWWYHSRVDGGTWRDPVAGASCTDRDIALAAGCP